ncbi:MAG: MFS transporter [Bacteroidota bacterium]
MAQRPKLSFWQIWNMSFGFFGIQFGFALQNANVSRIFETLGAKVDAIPVLWVAAPLTGLIVQPIIGYLSDNTWNRFGRRRPFFFVGAVLASIALLFMPNSPALWVAAMMLWIMDASINITMEPFRAFVGDMLPSEQRTNGFAMQSFFIGTGAVIASALPYFLTHVFNVENTALPGFIPNSVKYSFYLGGFIFFLAVLWTVLKTKEYSPAELESFEKEEHPERFAADLRHEKNQWLPTSTFYRRAAIWFPIGLILCFIIWNFSLEKELYILGGGIAAFGLMELLTGMFLNDDGKLRGFLTVTNDLNRLPKTMAQLAVVQFFSWFALFAMWIYTTQAVTANIYGTTDTTSALYNEGANWVGIMFAAYNGFAAVVAFLLPVLAKYTSRKITHMIALIAGGIGLASIFFIHEPGMLIFSMLGVGLAWASILSMPYAILTGCLPQNKMGTYMGIFNFFIVIPQLMAASILGFFVKNLFNGQPIYALVLGGISMVIAGLLTLTVEDKG